MKMLFLLLWLSPPLLAQTTYTVPFNVAPPGCETPWTEASVPMKINSNTCEWSSNNGTLSVYTGSLSVDLSTMPGVLQSAQLIFQNVTCNSCLVVRFLNQNVVVQEIIVANPGQPVNFTNPGSPITEIRISNTHFTITTMILTTAPPIASSMSATPTCVNQSTGTASVAISGGMTPYQIQWSTGATTPTISGLAPGTYSVSLTDQLGQSAQNTVTIPSLALPNAWFESFTDVSCYGGNNGSAAINVSGVSTPFSIFWPHDSSNANPKTDLSAGLYTAQITDNHGCTTTINLTIEQPTPLAVTEASHLNIDCATGTGSQIGLIAVGGVGAYNFNWSNGQSGNPLVNVPAGTYIASVTDSHNCLLTYTSTVTANGALPVNIAFIPPACNGNLGVLTAAVGNDMSNITYFWQDSIVGQTITGYAGSYWVAAVSPLGCSGTTSAVMSQPDSLKLQVVSVIPETGGQQNGSIMIMVTGGTAPYTFDWTGTAAFENTGDTLSNLPAGVYICTITDAHGCTVGLTEPIVIEALTATLDHKQEAVPVDIIPNPASDVLTIRTAAFDGTLRITVSDQSGKIVSVNEVPADAGRLKYELNVSDFSPGFYYLQLTDGQRFATKKVLIAR